MQNKKKISNKDLLIVIPAYNEEKNIFNTIFNIKKILPDVDIVVINDGSKDKTDTVAKEICTEVINHPKNLGDGAARQTSFRYALARQYKYLIHLDADGQHNPMDIPSILNELRKGDFDIIIGSRTLGTKSYAIPIFRNLGMKICNHIVSITTGKVITDSTSGFRGLNRKAMEFYAKYFYPKRYPDADVIIASHYAGLKIKEIPVNMNKRFYGKSLHGGLSPIYYIYKMCVSIFIIIFKILILKSYKTKTHIDFA